MTSWNVALVATLASDGSPVSGIAILEATAEARQLATTDATGAATVSLDVDPSQPPALYIATTRFSIQHNNQTNTNLVTVYDREVYERITAGLPPYAQSGPVWKVKYTITDSSDGSPITGISAIDPLTNAVLASNPNVTIAASPDKTCIMTSGPQGGTSIIGYA